MSEAWLFGLTVVCIVITHSLLDSYAICSDLIKVPESCGVVH